MKDEALKLALEALKANVIGTSGRMPKTHEAITAIKAALAQPAQEPVANLTIENGKLAIAAKILSDGVYDLYTTPPKREWVGLTLEETSGFTQHEMTVVKYVSKVLQEKNG